MVRQTPTKAEQEQLISNELAALVNFQNTARARIAAVAELVKDRVKLETINSRIANLLSQPDMLSDYEILQLESLEIKNRADILNLLTAENSISEIEKAIEDSGSKIEFLEKQLSIVQSGLVIPVASVNRNQ